MTEAEILKAAEVIQRRLFEERQERAQKAAEIARATVLAEVPPDPIRLPWVTCRGCHKSFKLTVYGPVETVFLPVDDDDDRVAAILCPHCNFEMSMD